jgi:hypothetical protein
MARNTRPIKIRVYWENPPTGAVYLERTTPTGTTEERRGPRAALTIEEAGAVLERSIAEVKRAIDAGFLRVHRRGAHVVVTPGACLEFLREEAEDRTLARDRRREATIPAVIRSRR